MHRALVLTLLVVGCGSDPAAPRYINGVELLPSFDVPAAPANGFQVVLPIVRGIKAGTDNEYCTWTDYIADRDLDVKAVQAFQSETGHHVVLFTTKKHQPAGTTRLCTDDDMATFRFGAGAGGEGVKDINEAPGDLVFLIPKGSQLVVNAHYLNASTKDHDAQSALSVFLADPSKQWIPSGSIALLKSELDIPEGRSALDINCTMQKRLESWLFIPHMHEWGSHIMVSRVSAAGKTESLFDTDWQPAYTFHPPEIRRDPSNPFVFEQGDQIKVRCEWNNTSGRKLWFGPEMCVAFAQTVDRDGSGNLDCDNGEWGTF